MFVDIHFQWPPTFNQVKTATSQKLANAAAKIGEAKGRLQNTPALAQVNNPVAGACAGSAAALDQLRAILAHETLCVCVHPWTQGVGQGEGVARYLSPANAIAAASAKFVDAADAHKPKTAMEAVCVVLSATGFKQLGDAVAQFCAVLPNPQLGLCQRRAQQLAALERDKIDMPGAPGNALWAPGRLSGTTPVRSGNTALGEQLAHAVGYEAGGKSALQELTALADKKQQAITAASDAIAALVATFAGGIGKGVFISAKAPEQIKNELAGSELDHDAPLAVCLVYAAPAEKLTVLKELLGL